MPEGFITAQSKTVQSAGIQRAKKAEELNTALSKTASFGIILLHQAIIFLKAQSDIVVQHLYRPVKATSALILY